MRPMPSHLTCPCSRFTVRPRLEDSSRWQTSGSPGHVPQPTGTIFVYVVRINVLISSQIRSSRLPSVRRSSTNLITGSTWTLRLRPAAWTSSGSSAEAPGRRNTFQDPMRILSTPAGQNRTGEVRYVLMYSITTELGDKGDHLGATPDCVVIAVEPGWIVCGEPDGALGGPFLELLIQVP